jgi:hypothetical protein
MPASLKNDSKPPAKPAAAAADSSPGLTERERMLLDRVEQLEKRVAELESVRGASGSLSTAGTNAPASAFRRNAIADNPTSINATPVNAASVSSIATTGNPSAPPLGPTSSLWSSLRATASSSGDAAGLAATASATSSAGVTPPGGKQGAPGSLVPGWALALRKTENRLNLAILVKF